MSSTIVRALALGLALAALAPSTTSAEIDGDALVASDAGVWLELPRGWRASEFSAYPGVLVWLSRTTPRVNILVTVDEQAPCRDPLRFCLGGDASASISVVRQQLEAAGFEITKQLVSRTPEIEYQAGRRFLRHATIVVGTRVVSVVMAADSPAVRAAQGRVFERMTQSVRALAPPRAADAAPVTSAD